MAAARTGRWGHRPLQGAPKNYTAPVGADLRAARRPMAAARTGRWGHRPLQFVFSCPKTPQLMAAEKNLKKSEKRC